HDVDALDRCDGVDVVNGRQVLDHDRQRDLAVRLLHVFLERDLPELRRAGRAGHAAVAEGRVAYGPDGLTGRARVADVRDLDALYAHVEQAQDEGRIEAGRAHDRRDAHALGRHDHELDVAQVEAGVLHVDEGRVVAGVPDDLDDLGIGDAARVGAERETARTQDLLHSIGLHGAFLPGVRALPDTARGVRLGQHRRWRARVEIVREQLAGHRAAAEARRRQPGDDPQIVAA